MERYCILAVPRLGEKVVPLKEMLCKEEKAIRECCRIFRITGMHKIVLVDENMAIIFKDTRRCRCSTIQKEFYPDGEGNLRYRNVCVDCHVVMDSNAWQVGAEDKEVISKS